MRRLHLGDESTANAFGQLTRSKQTFPSQVSMLTFGQKETLPPTN